jgi:hypothetical protein
MNKKRIASYLIFAGGVAELLVAALHFAMPATIGRAAEIAGLSLDYRNYVFHATIAVGMCMTAFGALSLYFSRKMAQGEQTMWAFALSQGILWTGRVVSELILPVRTPLFFLSNPTTVVLPMVVVIALLFLLPTLILWPGRRAKA